LAGDRDHITAELQGKRFRHDRHPSSEERILTGQESTEPGADPALAGRAVVCSARPGRRQAGWRCATTHGPQRADGAPAILESLRPRRRRSDRDRSTAATRRADRACPSLRRVARARRGRLPAREPQPLSALPSAATPGLPRSPRQPPGVRRDGRRATAARPARAQAAARAARCGPP
ncbi:hypothetical protein E1165_28555, partial [Micromonospora sp. KC723]